MTSTVPQAIRVVIVDDHPFVRLGLRAYFELVDEIDLVGEAGSATEAEHLIDKIASTGQLPDVVLMDLLLPDKDGVATTAALCQHHPGIAVVVLTSCNDAGRVRSALRAGAVGYVLKDAGPDKLLSTVRAAARGEGSLDSSLALKLTEPPPAAGFTALTAREQEVLGLVAEGRSNQQIAEELFITERTARTHVSHVLGKLGLSSRTQAALWAARQELVPRQ
ncbi:response regulator [Streptomyces sp. NPDC091217]|uniref:response regulator n=1 Tax=Streptomyces sp. NPDC091217 TaxID=3365975 RepID=UPI0037F5206D